MSPRNVPLPMKTIVPKEEQQKFFDATIELLRQFEHLPPEQMLALACNLVGKLIALQDQTKHTNAMIMQLVTDNIELGNQQALEDLLNSQGNA